MDIFAPLPAANQNPPVQALKEQRLLLQTLKEQRLLLQISSCAPIAWRKTQLNATPDPRAAGVKHAETSQR